ncbi:MAG TPA: glycosyltransferase family 4 protein [Leptolyngbyaceae cyanobacterium]
MLSLKLLFLSTPVAPLGKGLGGGVELTLQNIAQELIRRGHTVRVVAPQGSAIANLPIVEIEGELQASAQIQERNTPVSIPVNSVLANMWDYARRVQADYDLIVNFAYDWLPFYLTPFFECPIAHLLSMSSLSDAMDRIIQQVAERFPDTIGVHTMVQAATFPFAEVCRCLKNGFDMSLYDFCGQPKSAIAWVGRISPEKGLEEAVAAVEKTGDVLKIMGAMQDEDYWEKVNQAYPFARIEYLGFLSTDKLQKELGVCKAFLMTPHLVEGFGNVVVEALACGVPVICYRRGGPTEIIEHEKTGFLVEPDSIDGLVEAIKSIDRISRDACRASAEAEFSLAAMGDRVEEWFADILRSRKN